MSVPYELCSDSPHGASGTQSMVNDRAYKRLKALLEITAAYVRFWRISASNHR